MKNDRPVILLGAGGHARMLLEMIRQQKLTLLGYASPVISEQKPFTTLKWIGQDEFVFAKPADTVFVINALGSVGDTTRRRRLYNLFNDRDYHFKTLIHRTSTICKSGARFGDGLQIFPNVIINTNVTIGHNVLVNSGAIVEHDCIIGDHVHIASGAVVCGGCTIQQNCHIGANATINQNITIGEGAIVASGAVVIDNVEPYTLVAGVPAKVKQEAQQ